MSDSKDQAPNEQHDATGTVPDPGVTPPKPSCWQRIVKWFLRINNKPKGQIRDN